VNLLANRHYVALGHRGLRRHLIMKTVAAPGRRSGSVSLRYVIVGRRFTHRAAAKRARLLNAQNGRAH
jgi:hypothetical protein